MSDNDHDALDAMDETALLEHSQTVLLQKLSLGQLSVDQEVKYRGDIADWLLNSHRAQPRQEYVRDANQHLETILRRLPQESPLRVQYVSLLAEAKVSEHQMSQSNLALDHAIMYGCLARQLVLEGMTSERDHELHMKILTELGFAYSHRYGLTRSDEDLEEAISAARQIHENAPTSSPAYLLNLNNYAGRLRFRYLQNASVGDMDEAKKLVEELERHAAPGSFLRSSVLYRLGELAFDRWKMTESGEDIDEAIDKCTESFHLLPQYHETRTPALQGLRDMHEARYFKLDAPADLAKAVEYSALLIDALPYVHGSRNQHLLRHFRYLDLQVTAARSMAELDAHKAIIEAMLPKITFLPLQEQTQCKSVITKVLTKRYQITAQLEDLVAACSQVLNLSYEHDDGSRAAHSSQGEFRTGRLYGTHQSLSRLVARPSGDRMRILAAHRLCNDFIELTKTRESSAEALVALCDIHGDRLEIIADSAAKHQNLTEADVQHKLLKMKEERAARTAAQRANRQPVESDYKTIFGDRALAIDPRTTNIIFDLSGFMKELGFEADPNKTYTQAEMRRMEASMRQKGIDKARAAGRHPNLNLCYMCRDLCKIIKPSPSGLDLNTDGCFYPFGSYGQLVAREECAICRLILSLISTDTGRPISKLTKVDREVQGTSLKTGLLPTGEKLLVVHYSYRHVGEIRIVTPQNRRLSVRQDWESHDHALSPVAWANQVSIRHLRCWLGECDNTHGSQCNRLDHDGSALAGDHLTFIDVVENCLVARPASVKYFALSYVWGCVDMQKTMQSNVHQRFQPGALATVPFPKTMRDAMDLVRSLGERYLWIDAVCITQDDEAQKTKEFMRMNIVYGKAFATIVAVHGKDVNAGLPGVAPHSRAPQRMERVTISNRSPDLDHDPNSSENEVIELVASTRPLNLALDTSTWHTRGWILQEQYLSHRCLFFTPDAVYFQCGEGLQSECGIEDEYQISAFGQQLDAVEDRTEKLKKDVVEQPLADISRLSDLPITKRDHTVFTVYARLVQAYTKRHFSYKSDILKGFAGIFAALNIVLKSTTLHGLPASLLSHALLWAPAARLPRRGCDLVSIPNGEPDAAFPSWSWAGWDGPVDYHLLEFAEDEVHLPKPLITLCSIHDESSNKIVQIISAAPCQSPPDHKLSKETSTPRPTSDDSTDRAPDELEDNVTLASKTTDGKIVAKFIADPSRNSAWLIEPPPSVPSRAAPLITNILHLTAPTVALTHFKIHPEKHYLSDPTHVHIQTSQAVRRIYDHQNRHCGLWCEQAGYGYVGQGMSTESESKMVLLGISEYNDMLRPRKPPYRVEGEIPIFDRFAFPEAGDGSGLVNVLVVDFDMGYEEEIGDRATVAIVHKMAWEEARPVVRSVMVA